MTEHKTNLDPHKVSPKDFEGWRLSDLNQKEQSIYIAHFLPPHEHFRFGNYVAIRVRDVMLVSFPAMASSPPSKAIVVKKSDFPRLWNTLETLELGVDWQDYRYVGHAWLETVFEIIARIPENDRLVVNFMEHGFRGCRGGRPNQYLREMPDFMATLAEGIRKTEKKLANFKMDGIEQMPKRQVSFINLTRKYNDFLTLFNAILREENSDYARPTSTSADNNETRRVSKESSHPHIARSTTPEGHTAEAARSKLLSEFF